MFSSVKHSQRQASMWNVQYILYTVNMELMKGVFRLSLGWMHTIMVNLIFDVLCMVSAGIKRPKQCAKKQYMLV